MERIEDLMCSGVQAHYKTTEGEGWLPSLSIQPTFITYRLRDAWAVFTGRATAIQWPHQRRSTHD